MRVLLCHRPGGAFGYITDSWSNALRDRGHVVQRWDGQETSWRAFAPDLYIGASGHQQPIPTARNTKVALHVNPYGPVDLGDINESKESMDWTVRQRPDAVFGYGHDEDKLLWSYWTKKFAIPWVPMPTAGDKTLFRDLSIDRPHDLVYLGGRWAYKGQTIDEYLLPVLREGRLSYKLHGWGDWQPGLCSGQLPDDKVCRFFNSGKVGPCIAERHTHYHGIDIPERAFKVALCGTLIVHDAVPHQRRMIPSAEIANTPEQFKQHCHYYAAPENAAERKELAEKQKAEVLAAHTYHHRLAGLLAACGFADEAIGMIA
jgi:hypothetical protein